MNAEQFATHWHGAQVRKYTGEPYIEHCREIVEILRKWLHDVLEDTECDYVTMVDTFGDKVTRMLLDVLTKGDASLRERLKCLLSE